MCREERIQFTRKHFGFQTLTENNKDVECDDLVPLVLGGDFNATPFSQVYKFMFPQNEYPDPPPDYTPHGDSQGSNGFHSAPIATSGAASGAADPESSHHKGKLSALVLLVLMFFEAAWAMDSTASTGKSEKNAILLCQSKNQTVMNLQSV